MPAPPGQLTREFWTAKGPANFMLLPLAGLFGLAVRLRALAYRTGVCKAAPTPLPVVVAGGIAAGGGGKTTLAIALIEALRAQGLTPGLVARGYKRRLRGPAMVSASSDPAAAGDEAVMVAALTGAPVAVAEDRTSAVRLLAGSRPDVDVAVSDDGLQHLAMRRVFELAVIGGRHGLGNRWLLPAGPLREPVSRLRTVDAVVRKDDAPGPGEYALTLGEPRLYDQQGAEMAFADVKKRKCVALAGLADPAGFFGDLQAAGLAPDRCLPFPDHHAYRKEDLVGIDAELLLMTSKDAVKCRPLGDPRIVEFRRDPTLDPSLAAAIAARVRSSRTA